MSLRAQKIRSTLLRIWYLSLAQLRRAFDNVMCGVKKRVYPLKSVNSLGKLGKVLICYIFAMTTAFQFYRIIATRHQRQRVQSLKIMGLS